VPEGEGLAERFEQNRTRLRAVAYRMLGSLAEADDAVQEAWFRLSRAGTNGVADLRGWLTTVVARVCLDMLRSRNARREVVLDTHMPDAIVSRAGGIDPEHEAVLADSVGLALLVVLERLTPAERLAFVLHDMFDLPFDEIAPLVGRSPPAARQLASRARRRVQGAATAADADRTRQREVVDAFLAAARAGDFAALLGVLDPDVVVRTEHAQVRGAPAVAERAMKERARAARAALVNGAVGVIVAPQGRLLMVLRFTIGRGRILAIDVVSDPARLRRLDLAVLAP